MEAVDIRGGLFVQGTGSRVLIFVKICPVNSDHFSLDPALSFDEGSGGSVSSRMDAILSEIRGMNTIQPGSPLTLSPMGETVSKEIRGPDWASNKAQKDRGASRNIIHAKIYIGAIRRVFFEKLVPQNRTVHLKGTLPMKRFMLLSLFLCATASVHAQSASSWTAGVGYSGIRFDDEIFPVGIYAQATRKINGHMAVVASVTRHSKSESEQDGELSVDLTNSLLGALGGIMVVAPLTPSPLNSGSSFLYGTAKIGVEKWGTKAKSNIPLLSGSTSVDESENGFAFELGAGLQARIRRHIALDMSVAYRRKNYDFGLAGETFSFNDFVWYGGLIFRL